MAFVGNYIPVGTRKIKELYSLKLFSMKQEHPEGRKIAISIPLLIVLLIVLGVIAYFGITAIS